MTADASRRMGGPLVTRRHSNVSVLGERGDNRVSRSSITGATVSPLSAVAAAPRATQRRREHRRLTRYRTRQARAPKRKAAAAAAVRASRALEPAAAGLLLTRRVARRVMRCWSARTTAVCAAGTRPRRSCGGARPAVTRGAAQLRVTRRLSSVLTPSARDSPPQRGGVHRLRALREAAVLRRRRRHRRGGRRNGRGAAEVDCGLAPAHLHRALARCAQAPLSLGPAPSAPRLRARRHLMIDNLYATPLIGPTPVEAMKIRYL